MSNTDRAWFKKNGKRNVRLRLPGAGEVEAIMRHSLPSTAYDIAAAGGTVNPPDPGVKWVVVVINVDREKLLRMLILRPIEWAESDTIEGAFSAATMFFGPNLVMDRVAG